MRILKTSLSSDRRAIDKLKNRSFLDKDTEQKVDAIIEGVRRRGDAAVAGYTERFDHVSLSPRRFRVHPGAIASAKKRAGTAFLSTLREVRKNLESYHRRQKPEDWVIDVGNGGKVGERWLPLKRVGVYVPAGKAPLVSSALMGVVPARVAGVKEVAVFSPPGPKGDINPFILAACGVLGVKEVYRVGGAQAVAAMAIGTKTIRKVDKVFGPGNIFVTMAKKALYGSVGIDIVAGPSEVLIVADDHADPSLVAVDLLSQAEHGTGREICVLVTDSARLAERVRAELKSRTASPPESPLANRSLLSAITLVVTKTLAEAVEFANDFAAEHVEVMTRRASSVARQIKNGGALFVGAYSPVPLGDFYAGPNHVLPTGGAATFLSGLSVLDFMKRMSVISYTKKSLLAAQSSVSKMAEVEGLPIHGEAVRMRFDRSPR
jgi:histidinol dehydrogenase